MFYWAIVLHAFKQVFSTFLTKHPVTSKNINMYENIKKPPRLSALSLSYDVLSYTSLGIKPRPLSLRLQYT